MYKGGNISVSAAVVGNLILLGWFCMFAGSRKDKKLNTKNMKQIHILLISLLLLSGHSFSQTHQQQQTTTREIKNNLNNLLPNGKIVADVMTSVKQSKRREELSEKSLAGIQQNYEWFIDYMKSYPDGKPKPYHPNLGVTEDEYKELQSLLSDIEFVSSLNSHITIKRKNNIIEFEADNKSLKLLEYVKIDLLKNIVTIGEYELSFSDTINITDDKNGLKSKWKGYVWKLEEPQGIDFDALKDLQSLKTKQYKFTIGRLEKNNKTFMSIKGQEVENGVSKVNFELPLIF